MPTLLRMPKLAADVEVGTLQSWLTELNEPFAAGDAIVNVETAKAAVDVEADTAGVVLRRLVDAGGEVAVGEPIALVGAIGEEVADLAGAIERLRGQTAAPGLDNAPADRPEPPTVVAERQFSSPLARALARDVGLDIADIAGTGPNGRVVRRDVETAIARRDATSRDRAHAPTAAGSHLDVPHSRMRSAIAQRLTHSVTTAPHFHLHGIARIDRLLKLRSRMNALAPTRISLNDLVVKAVAGAHRTVPELNVVWTDNAVRHYEEVDVAIAVSTESGLLTPVLRSVQASSITTIAAATSDLAARAQLGELGPDELAGGSITVTNLGKHAVTAFAAVINPPHASILSVGAARMEAVASRGKHPGKARLRPATVVHLVLSVDHRPVDGATAALWMDALVDLLENPLGIVI